MANIFLFKGGVKGKVVLVGGAMSFFFGDCGSVDGNGTTMEACFFFRRYECAFLFNRLGAFPFYCGKEDFGGYTSSLGIESLSLNSE